MTGWVLSGHGTRALTPLGPHSNVAPASLATSSSCAAVFCCISMLKSPRNRSLVNRGAEPALVPSSLAGCAHQLRPPLPFERPLEERDRRGRRPAVAPGPRRDSMNQVSIKPGAVQCRCRCSCGAVGACCYGAVSVKRREVYTISSLMPDEGAGCIVPQPSVQKLAVVLLSDHGPAHLLESHEDL